MRAGWSLTGAGLAVCLALWPGLSRAAEPVDLVDPFVGTSGDHGQLTPAATGPYGMVQLSPDTQPAQHAGYDFTADRLTGFSHTRAVGVGCGGGGGDLHVAVGYVGDGASWAMDKASEKAGPGWYSVRYGDGVQADLAAIGAAGVSRFTVPHAGIVRIVIDPRHSYTKRHSAEWTSRSSDALAGRMSAGTVCERGVYHLAFAAVLTLNDRPLAVRGADLGDDRIAFDVPVEAGDRITLRAALSVVDSESAREVLDAQVGPLDVEAVRAASREAWATELNRVRVTGDAGRERLLYTMLFRAMQTPVRIDDAQGRYRRSDGVLHQVPVGRHRYASWAIWDNYRTQLPLLALLDPDRSADIAASLAELYLAGKAQWATQNEPFITVRTEHAGVALLDFRRKGVDGFDATSVLPLMIAELDDLPRRSPDQQIETAYDVWAASELARDLGQVELADQLRAQALSYRTMWTAVFRDVADDFDVVKARGLYQGTLWQYRWAPVFDLDWLVNEGLGRERFLAELSRFFDQDLFNMTNQPDIQTPVLFAAAGRPEHTRRLVDQILHQPMDHWYTNSGRRDVAWRGRAFALDPVGYADGMDDDAGAMAAWYVWASLGLYPLTPGLPTYVVTPPSFSRVEITPSIGAPISIERDEAGAAGEDAVQWNDRDVPGGMIAHAQIRAGGRLRIQTRPML